jgi:hypothetical protein
MTLLLIPTTLFAILLLTSVLCSIAGVATITRLPSTSTPKSPIAGFYPEWITFPLEPSVKHITIENPEPLVVKEPIRVRLHWRSSSMSAIPDQKISMIESDKSSIEENTSQPTARAMKRFSIQLPLQASDTREFSHSPTNSESISPSNSVESPFPTADPGNFLTALAAQERRVLELREELDKAESDLSKLKRQWAIHEATKKRNEIRHTEPLRPLKSPNEDFKFPPQAEAKSAREKEKRRSIHVKTKSTQRKVFEGGRHTRALSLLSPTSLVNRGSVAAPVDIANVERDIERVPHTAIPKVSTMPVQARMQQRGTKEDIVSTGKQLVGDLREGLWTFIEDLRQATVGDEALSAARSKQIETSINSAQGRNVRNGTPIKVAQAPRKRISEAPATTGMSMSEECTSKPEKLVLPNADSSDEDDGWSNWDSPPPKDASTFSSTARSTPRSSLR